MEGVRTLVVNCKTNLLNLISLSLAIITIVPEFLSIMQIDRNSIMTCINFLK
jgi:hypothetical protein